MQWFDDVQIFLVIIFGALLLNIVLFLIVGRKRREAILNNSADASVERIGRRSSFELFMNAADGQERRVLFVLNDFSDLVLYFGPILLAILRSNCDVFVLNIQPCYGQRYFWLKKCVDVLCQTMGFSNSNVTFVWDERFPDQQTNSADDPWPILSLMHIIHSYAMLYDVDFITTYDADGINENAARQAINEAVSGLWRKRMLPKHVEIYLLTSASILRSMAGIFDTPISYMSLRLGISSGRLMSSLKDILVLQRLYVLCEWRRGVMGLCTVIKVCLILVLNRYFLINDYHKIQDEEKYRL